MNEAHAIDPNAVGPDGLPLIFWKIDQFDLDGVRALLDAGVPIETPGFAGATPALSAASGDVWSACLMLLERGANPLAIDENGMTIPWLASTSRVNPESREGAALNGVRQLLNEKGVIGMVYEPKKAKKMAARGHWPPQ